MEPRQGLDYIFTSLFCNEQADRLFKFARRRYTSTQCLLVSFSMRRLFETVHCSAVTDTPSSQRLATDDFHTTQVVPRIHTNSNLHFDNSRQYELHNLFTYILILFNPAYVVTVLRQAALEISILGKGGIFRQCTGSVPTQHRQEFE